MFLHELITIRKVKIDPDTEEMVPVLEEVEDDNGNIVLREHIVYESEKDESGLPKHFLPDTLEAYNVMKGLRLNKSIKDHFELLVTKKDPDLGKDIEVSIMSTLDEHLYDYANEYAQLIDFICKSPVFRIDEEVQMGEDRTLVLKIEKIKVDTEKMDYFYKVDKIDGWLEEKEFKKYYELSIISALEGMKDGKFYDVLGETIGLKQDQGTLEFVVMKNNEGEVTWETCGLTAKQVFADWVLNPDIKK